MNRKEFILQAAISMAGKVIRIDGTTEVGVWESVMCEAEKLANEVENAGYEFD